MRSKTAPLHVLSQGVRGRRRESGGRRGRYRVLVWVVTGGRVAEVPTQMPPAAPTRPGGKHVAGRWHAGDALVARRMWRRWDGRRGV